MVDTVERREGTYRGQPYELHVFISHADESPYISRDERKVEARTKKSLAPFAPSADVEVVVKNRECIESYEKTILWWTYDSHEPRPVEEHVEDVMATFEVKVDERLEKYEENVLEAEI